MSIKNDLFYISQLRFLQEEYAITDLVIETIIQLNCIIVIIIANYFRPRTFQHSHNVMLIESITGTISIKLINRPSIFVCVSAPRMQIRRSFENFRGRLSF